MLNKKVYFRTFGCKVNISETENFKNLLDQYKLKISNDIKEADIVVINSCCVTENASHKCIQYIKSIKSIKTAIIFGSYSRGDWNKSSDIDLFVFGNVGNFDKAKFELKLKKEIQVFHYTKIKKIKEKLDSNLIPNIIKGFNIKETLEPFEVRLSV